MDDYLIGSALADEFDTDDCWTYSDPGTAVVYSSHSSIARPIHNDFDDQADHVALVACDNNGAGRMMDVPKEDIALLIEQWGIPKAAISCLFTNDPSQGLYTAANDGRLCTWYHVPVQRFSEAGFDHGQIHVWQVLDTTTSRIRVLVACPPYMMEPLSSTLERMAGTPEPESARIDWTRVHSVVIRAAVKTWEDTRWITMSSAAIAIRRMVTALDGALTSGPVTSCNDSLLEILTSVDYLTQIRQLAHDLTSRLGTEIPLGGNVAIPSISAEMRNWSSTIDCLLSSYEFMQKSLYLSRHKFCTSIETRNASYVRSNTIALRRIAQQNQIDIAEQKKQSASALRESHSMAKIAYMTMLYLPAAFTAVSHRQISLTHRTLWLTFWDGKTFFSMPFFALDETLQFSAPEQIWWFVVVATVLTILTFLGSRALDRLSHASPTTEQHGDIEHVDQTALHIADIDARILEPGPYIEPTKRELIEQVLNAMGQNHDFDVDNDVADVGAVEVRGD
ncbi:hypothetical protein LTR56_010481 [Elasticomyces elasticus]|nr:hypothetical protein LTR56_010481 [Elasticomyces elasticus]KAK3657897.1 hypothetical protein LTR22_009124 [Elasticomyces elasticus]KAK4917583.1 hypothetical protein LTR49_014537 [Elasticomyces elasticus]KAK5762803.1 hypothetical protein LTS12_006992 [Elasticomyces elasticus]